MRTSALLVGLSLLACLPGIATAQDASGSQSAQVFATVGETRISLDEYADALRDGVRKRFYHGRVPEAQLAKFQREIGQQLVDRALQVQEARRRELRVDEAPIDAAVKAADERFSSHPNWPQHRERVLAGLRKDLLGQALAERLESAVRDVPPASEQAVRAYYDAHPEKFTEPERIRVSLLLLSVDPSSPREVWDQRRQEAQALHFRLTEGADFAELARDFSDDSTAEQGGDMGYVHQGMLGAVAQSALEKLAPGQITEPVMLLEGVALFRLTERQPAKLNDFDTVRERARALLRRERAEAAWQALMARLRASTPITVHEEHYLPMPPEAPGQS